MAVDESFTKPGAVPFKWEIKPGVPKHHHQRPHNLQNQQHHQNQLQLHHHHPLAAPPQKLTPPPVGSYLLQTTVPRSRLFGSSPRIRSDRWRFEQSAFARTESVSSGCFPSPLLRRSLSKRLVQKSVPRSESDYSSDVDTPSRWSVSSRKSLSPFRESLPSSPSTLSSYQRSPRPGSDAEWAGFGLF